MTIKLTTKPTTPITTKPTPMNHLEDVVRARKRDNTVFITITTYAYRLFTLDFYQHSNLTQYPSFFVVTQDQLTYSVPSPLSPHA